MTPAVGALRQALGPRALLCGYPHPANRRWLVGDEMGAQAFSAGSLCVAGELPLLCGCLSAAPLALDLLGEAGWELPDRLLVFRDAAELGDLIRTETGRGARLVASFPLPEETAPAAVHAVPPVLRGWLNNKANLEALAPSGLVPARRVVSASKLLERPELARGRVLKICTSDCGGGGRDVLLPPDSGDAALVRALLAGTEEAVLEEPLAFSSTRCFNYLIDEAGTPRFLGAPEQFMAGGVYLGNWFRAGDRPDPGAIDAGAGICRRAAALGYRGVAGLDAGFLPDGSFRFFDLNFRMNGSTAPLLLFHELQRRTGVPVALRTVLRGRADPHSLVAALRALNRTARLVPLSLTFSSLEDPQPEFLVSAFLPGAHRAEVLASFADLRLSLGCP